MSIALNVCMWQNKCASKCLRQTKIEQFYTGLTVCAVHDESIEFITFEKPKTKKNYCRKRNSFGIVRCLTAIASTATVSSLLSTQEIRSVFFVSIISWKRQKRFICFASCEDDARNTFRWPVQLCLKIDVLNFDLLSKCMRFCVRWEMWKFSKKILKFLFSVPFSSCALFVTNLLNQENFVVNVNVFFSTAVMWRHQSNERLTSNYYYLFSVHLWLHRQFNIFKWQFSFALQILMKSKTKQD